MRRYENEKTVGKCLRLMKNKKNSHEQVAFVQLFKITKGEKRKEMFPNMMSVE